jgi:hypothetical protein
MNQIDVLREAWGLFRSDETVETLAAVVLAATVLIPLWFTLTRDNDKPRDGAGGRR